MGIGEVGYVLTDVFAGVFGEAFLSGGIEVCKEAPGEEHLGDVFVFGELGFVVGGDGEYVSFKGLEELHDELGHGPCVLPSRELCHE